MRDTRNAIVAWALWLEQHHNRATYSEGPGRYFNLNRRGILPFIGDCSATLRDYYNWAGAPDPYKLGYGDPEGYTGTELAAGTHIPLLRQNALEARIDEVLPGDAVVYGPGTGWHTALVVLTRGLDILTVSMGEQGDPNFVWVNRPVGPSLGLPADGRLPQTYLRFPTLAPRVYWPAGFTPGPSPLQARRAGLKCARPLEAANAARAGLPVYGWSGSWFRPEGSTVTLGDRRWISVHFDIKKGA